ncbi:MAG: flagellar protein FliS [bacterium]
MISENKQPDSPESVILKLYDAGIEQCEQQNKVGVKQALEHLIDSLNFEYSEMAGSFFNLYDYAIRAADLGDFDEALFILKGLRSTWEECVVAREGISATV